MTILQQVAPPNLALAPEEYERGYTDQANNILRLYFNRLNGNVNAVTGVNGGQYLQVPYASFISNQTQTASVINTPYGVTFTSATLENGVSVDYAGDASQVVVSESGVYNFAFSLQLTSTAGSAKNIWVWAAIDGVNVDDSATRVVVAGSSAEDVAAWNFFLPMNAGQYFQLMWAVDHLGVQILAEPATAFCPLIPSAILTVNLFSRLPEAV